jgi:hypothetical protein
MLRDGATLFASDIARQAMTDKELNYETERQLRIEFTRWITNQLNAMARKGEVAKIGSGRAAPEVACHPMARRASRHLGSPTLAALEEPGVELG